MPEHLHILLGEKEEGMRLDQAAATSIPQWSRSFLQHAIRVGEILLNGSQASCSDTVHQGDSLLCAITPPTLPSPAPEDIPLAILHEDNDILVIDKPAGLVVHPSAGCPSGTVVNALLHRNPEIFSAMLSEDGLRPGIVHRLDRDTSGALIVAKSIAAKEKLKLFFQTHQVHKIYLAIVRGIMPETAGVIQAPIGRHPVNPLKRSVVKKGGKEAITEYETLCVSPDQTASLLKIRLHTGRTHQIRVHCAHLRHPVLGDGMYGGGSFSDTCPAQRQMLHAWKIRFPHPVTGENMAFTSPVPEDFRKIAQLLHLAK